VLKTYFDGINSADYEQAWLMLSPRLRGPSWSSFAKGTSTSWHPTRPAVGDPWIRPVGDRACDVQ